MDVHAYNLVLGILAVWRVTHLLNAEDGPWEIFVRIRKLAGPGFMGQLLDCFYCLSLWIALLFALLLGKQWLERVLLLLAFSAGAILLERVTLRHEPTPFIYREDQEVDHELLRKGENERDSSVEHKT
jgi:hypothetical protein